MELVVIQNRQVVTSSLQVAETFGKEHRNVLRAIDEISGVAQNSADLFYESFYTHSQNGQQYRMFYMNRDGFTLLAMGFTGKKALDFKMKYIEEFNRMESQLEKPKLPGSYKEALLALVEEVERSEALQLEMEKQKPKVLLAESIENSDDLILVKDLANILKQGGYDIGQNRLFEVLREQGYLIKSGTSRNTPTQRSMNMGLFRVVEGTRTSSEGIRITRTAKVTGKGQRYFVNKFLGNENSKK